MLVAFTLEANDAEGVSLDAAAVRRGVSRARGSGLARYWIAVDGDGQAVASASITAESNFYGAHYWWVQSLFVSAAAKWPCRPAAGPPGRTAASAGALDLRLYAHEDNARAHRVYRCAFTRAPCPHEAERDDGRGTSATRES